MLLYQQDKHSSSPIGQLKGVFSLVNNYEVVHVVLSFLDPLFSAVVNFSKSAAEFHRRLEQVDKKE